MRVYKGGREPAGAKQEEQKLVSRDESSAVLDTLDKSTVSDKLPNANGGNCLKRKKFLLQQISLGKLIFKVLVIIKNHFPKRI